MLKIWICIFFIFLLYSATVYSAPVEITIEYGNETCIESWSCTEWSSCSGGTQIRTCTDDNNCGTTVNKSAESQGCTSGPAGPSGPSGPSTAKTKNKTVSQPKPYIPPEPALKESDFLKMEMIAPEKAESGEPISVVVTLKTAKAIETNVEILGEKQDVSLKTGETKTLNFIVYTPETEGNYNLVATTPYATANKTIYLVYKPLFLYVTPMGDQNYEIHIKDFENKSTTELEVVKNIMQTVYLDTLDGRIDYRINISLNPGEYRFKAKTMSGFNILDEDERILKVEGNPVFNYGFWILGGAIAIVLFVSILLILRSRKVSK